MEMSNEGSRVVSVPSALSPGSSSLLQIKPQCPSLTSQLETTDRSLLAIFAKHSARLESGQGIAIRRPSADPLHQQAITRLSHERPPQVFRIITVEHQADFGTPSGGHVVGEFSVDVIQARFASEIQ